MKTLFRLAIVWLFLFGTYPAAAQFTDQATYVATPGGTANAITLSVPNWTRNLPGVPIRFLPGSTNTAATTVNVGALGAIAINKRTNSGLVALSGGEIRSGVMATIAYDGTVWVLSDTLGTFTDINTYTNAALANGMPYNFSLSASVGTNALTITLQTAGGSTPSAASPVIIPFRNSTIGSGVLQNVSVTGALSFTIASGSTMGCVSGQMCRLWVVAICSSGLSCTGSPGTDTVGMCAFNAKSGTNIGPIYESALQSSASGTSGGNSAQTYYCNISSVTARAIRILGYIDIQQVTAGTWATSPTVVQPFGVGIAKPGETIQYRTQVSTTQSNVSGGTPIQVTDIVLSISPSSAANQIRVSLYGTFLANGLSVGLAKISRGTGPTYIGNAVQIAASSTSGAAFSAMDNPNTTSSTTYTLYLVSPAGGTVTWNIGGIPSYFELQEIMG